MPPAFRDAGVWEAALAWLTRDQECRFSHPLEWRDPDTASRSPVRGRSIDERLTIVRALLGALSPEENLSKQHEEVTEKELQSLRVQRDRLDWHLARMRAGLAGAFGQAIEAAPKSELEAAGDRKGVGWGKSCAVGVNFG